MTLTDAKLTEPAAAATPGPRGDSATAIAPASAHA